MLSWLGEPMLKWLIVVLLMVLLTGLLRPGIVRGLRIGRLPGDLHFRLWGRRIHLPFTSTILLSLLAWALLRAL
jgi:DUF2905 family protein